MKINLLFPFDSLLLAALFLQSCAPKYGPAYLGSNNAYIAKPAYKGEKANVVGLSGRVNKGVVYYDGEKNNTFEFSGHVSLMRKHFYYSACLFGYWGKYQVDTAAGSVVRLTPFQVKGNGFRHEIGGRIPLDESFDMLLGIGLQTFRERGEFAALTKDELGEVVTKIALFPFLGPDIIDKELKGGGGGFDLNMDIRYAPSANKFVGMRYSWGFSKGKGATSPLRVHQVTLHGTVNHFTLYGQIGFSEYRQRLYDVQGNLFNAGLAYTIPFGRKSTPRT